MKDLQQFNLWACLTYCVPKEQWVVFYIALGSTIIYGAAAFLRLIIWFFDRKKASP